MRKLIGLGLAAPLLAACATISPGAPASGTCKNEALQRFVGQPATAELGAQILAAAGVPNLQWIAAGTMVTMEYRADRVRVYLDEQNRVQRASCG